MGRSFVKCLATLVMAVFIAGPLSASEGSDSANELASLLKGYESYQADFIQIVVNFVHESLQQYLQHHQELPWFYRAVQHLGPNCLSVVMRKSF